MNDDGFLIDDELEALTITDSPQKKRRKLNSNSKSLKSNPRIKKYEEESDLDGFIVDDGDSDFVVDDALCDDDLDLESGLFGIKLEPESNNGTNHNGNGRKLRRSQRNKNKNK